MRWPRLPGPGAAAARPATLLGRYLWAAPRWRPSTGGVAQLTASRRCPGASVLTTSALGSFLVGDDGTRIWPATPIFGIRQLA